MNSIKDYEQDLKKFGTVYQKKAYLQGVTGGEPRKSKGIPKQYKSFKDAIGNVYPGDVYCCKLTSINKGTTFYIGKGMIKKIYTNPEGEVSIICNMSKKSFGADIFLSDKHYKNVDFFVWPAFEREEINDETFDKMLISEPESIEIPELVPSTPIDIPDTSKVTFKHM